MPRGLKFQERPGGAPAECVPELPTDPTALSDTELMNLLYRFAEWASYAQCTLAVAAVQEKGAEIELARAKSRALSTTPDRKAVTAARNAAAQHPDVIAAEDEAYRA